jgi:hypothetical protein
LGDAEIVEWRIGLLNWASFAEWFEVFGVEDRSVKHLIGQSLLLEMRADVSAERAFERSG